jgi:serine/threonine protein kinase
VTPPRLALPGQTVHNHGVAVEERDGSEHAIAVAREVVQQGLADAAELRPLLREYGQRLSTGERVAFGRLLLERGLLDEAGLQRVEAKVPTPPAFGARLGAELGADPIALTVSYEKVLGPDALRLDSTASDPADAPPSILIDEGDTVTASTARSNEDLLPQARKPRAGETLGGYELLEVIGGGGMGIVFKARKADTDALYAVKVLIARDGPAGQRRRERFAREVDALHRLQHRNVVKVHEFGRERSFDWYVMDWIDGRELGDLIGKGLLSLEERLDIFIDVCRGVAHAHLAGVIHRDLKPSNVLIDAASRVFVVDFGLAKISDSTEANLTHDGSSLGTPYYMSPEQLVSPKDVDARADVFSLGVMLYELACSVRPFTGATAVEVSNRILNHPPPPPSRFKKDLPAGLEAMIHKALEKDPASRYQDVDGLRREVETLRPPRPDPDSGDHPPPAVTGSVRGSLSGRLPPGPRPAGPTPDTTPPGRLVTPGPQASVTGSNLIAPANQTSRFKAPPPETPRSPEPVRGTSRRAPLPVVAESGDAARPTGAIGEGLRWLAEHKDGVLVGVVLATLVYVPLFVIAILAVALAR